MSNIEQSGPGEEHRFHRYRGNVIPWFVRVMWLGFWIFAVVYVLKYFLPALQIEMVTPP